MIGRQTKTGPKDMRIPKYCVYNQTNECFLSLGTRPGCYPSAVVKRWSRRDDTSVDEGYWLAPVRRMKTLGFMSLYDLLYLDESK